MSQILKHCIINLMTRNEMLIMRKVNLTMEEIHKYSTIKRLIETDGNKKRAAIALNCSFRHVKHPLLHTQYYHQKYNSRKLLNLLMQTSFFQ